MLSTRNFGFYFVLARGRLTSRSLPIFFRFFLFFPWVLIPPVQILYRLRLSAHPPPTSHVTLYVVISILLTTSASPRKSRTLRRLPPSAQNFFPCSVRSPTPDYFSREENRFRGRRPVRGSAPLFSSLPVPHSSPSQVSSNMNSCMLQPGMRPSRLYPFRPRVCTSP